MNLNNNAQVKPSGVCLHLTPPNKQQQSDLHRLLILLLLACCCISFNAHAQRQNQLRLYDVEVLIFRHVGPSRLQTKPMIDYTELGIPLRHPSQDGEDYLTPTHGMETAWRKINNSGAYEAIAFRRWRQATSSYQRPRRYRLHGDQIIIDHSAQSDFLDDPFAQEELPDYNDETELDDAAPDIIDEEPSLFDLEEAYKVPFLSLIHI